MKQGKKRASNEIQDVENSGNFYKLVLVPRLKKSGSNKVVLVPHLLVSVPSKKKWL